MLKIEEWPIDKLIPYARNPRKNDAAVERMVSAIREFGFRIPVVAKSDGTVVDGHLRIKAAKKMGLSDVPVVLADELTDAQIKAFRLLANRSVNWSEWDEGLIKLEFEDLKALDFDLDLTGFDLAEIESFTIDDPCDISEEFDDEKNNSPATLKASISIPPRLWLTASAPMVKAFNNLAAECGVIIQWPD